MKKLQNELTEIKKGKPYITKDDLNQMHCLKAVIKETLRLYPLILLLVPHILTKDVNANGYDIVARTIVITNAWAIGRNVKL